LFIEGEKRLTPYRDPVVWWALFKGDDTFHWRRTDWAPSERTSAWRRC
jgi:hypothetical protein